MMFITFWTVCFLPSFNPQVRGCTRKKNSNPEMSNVTALACKPSVSFSPVDRLKMSGGYMFPGRAPGEGQRFDFLCLSAGGRLAVRSLACFKLSDSNGNQNQDLKLLSTLKKIK